MTDELPPIGFTPSEKRRKCWAYAYLCREGKHYVGTTYYPKLRDKQHRSGRGCTFTHKYPVLARIELIEIPIDVGRMEYETAMTIGYMRRFGIDNVRGGIYLSSELDEKQRETIERIITERRHQVDLKSIAEGEERWEHYLDRMNIIIPSRLRILPSSCFH